MTRIFITNNFLGDSLCAIGSLNTGGAALLVTANKGAIKAAWTAINPGSYKYVCFTIDNDEATEKLESLLASIGGRKP